MALELQKHQQDAYDNVKKYFEEGDRSIVIFPTGCGKSFVSLKLMEDNRNSKILFVSPSKPIRNQMYEYIITFLSTDETNELIRQETERKGRELQIAEKVKIILPGFETVLYQTLISKSNNTQRILDKLKPDFIICDEVHHVKTLKQEEGIERTEEEIEENVKEQENIWGTAMVELVEKNPQAKILGITATPERGDGVNVAIKFFNEKIASEISLVQAITSDEIPVKAPDYIPCVYTLISQLDEKSIQEQIEMYKITNPNKSKVLQQKLEEIRKIAYSGKGISDLFTEHLTTEEAKQLGRDKGKYIVFCASVEDMKQKMEEAKDWFSGVDSEPEIYAVSSKYNYSQSDLTENQSTSQQIISQFEKSKTEHIKLLFSVDMLNEGLHVDDVSGVIMIRKTNARNVYLQQLGRAISSDAKKVRPLVFDIVNNYLTYNIYDELVSTGKRNEEQQKSSKGRERVGKDGTDEYVDSDDKWIETFKVDGVMRDLLDLLENQNIGKNAAEELLEKFAILKRNGVKVSKISKRDTTSTLAQKTKGIDIERLVEEGLDLDENIGQKLIRLISVYRGTNKGKAPTEEQIKIFEEEYGISFERQDKNASEKLLEKLEILKRNGVDTSKIVQRDTIRTLAHKTEGIDLEKLVEEGLDLDDKIGGKLNNIRNSLKGIGSTESPTEEQVRIFEEEYGILLRKQEKDVCQEFLKKLSILKRMGVSVFEIAQKDTVRTLAQKNEGVDLGRLVEEGLDLDDKIGSVLNNLKNAYRGNKNGSRAPTEEQIKILEEEYGISFNKQNATEELLSKLKILKRIGVNTSKLTSEDTVRTLAYKTEGIDLRKLVEEGLDLDDNIGSSLSTRRRTYNAPVKTKKDGRTVGTPPTEEQVRIFEEEYGILIQKKKTKTQDIGQATYTATALECDEASDTIHELVTDKKKQNPILSYQE